MRRSNIVTAQELVKELTENSKLLVTIDDEYIYVGRKALNYGKPFLFIPVNADKLADCELDGTLPEADLQKFIMTKLDSLFVTNASLRFQ